jgi:hypothetical protein
MGVCVVAGAFRWGVNEINVQSGSVQMKVFYVRDWLT